METDDRTPEGGAGEPQKELELSPEEGQGVPQEPPKDEGGDPFDDIRDPQAREEAKKYRAIVRRNKEKEISEKPKEPTPTSGFMTKQDFYKSNERKAIRALTVPEEGDTEEVRSRKESLAENWDKVSALYTPRHGRETPEDIIEDIKDATILYEARNPQKAKDDSAKELQTTPGVRGTAPKKADTKQEPPRFYQAVQPTDWYKKS